MRGADTRVAGHEATEIGGVPGHVGRADRGDDAAGEAGEDDERDECGQSSGRQPCRGGRRVDGEPEE